MHRSALTLTGKPELLPFAPRCCADAVRARASRQLRTRSGRRMLHVLEQIVCNDVTFTLIFLGCLFLGSLIIGIAVAVLPRERFARDVKNLSDENPLAFITPDIEKFRHSFQLRLPRCGVVMPVKGVHDQSYANWRAQVTSLYGGPLEFYFCVETEDDPAYPHVQRLMRENPDHAIHLLVAGVSWHCSQKIHNQMHGFERAMYSCEYVIVLDDDIKLHPGTIRAWVEELESDPRVLAASGYAFEYVGKGVTSLASYCAMLWRCLASNGFSDPNDRPANVWGGAMIFRSKELRRGLYGLTDAWRDGGYSEDYITLSMARYHNRALSVPKSAIFPNELGDIQFDRFWNFMCRQIFVLTQTYATTAQRFIAIGSMGFNCTMHFFIALAALLASALTATLVLGALSNAVLGSGGGAASAASPDAIFATLGASGACVRHGAMYCTLTFWLIAIAIGFAFKRMLRGFSHLCNVLSPHGYDNEPIEVDHIPALRISFAYLIFSALIPAATAATLTSSAIVWAGVNFHITNGRVSKMERKDGKGGKPVGEWYSIPREVSLERTLKELAEFRMQQEGIVR